MKIIMEIILETLTQKNDYNGLPYAIEKCVDEYKDFIKEIILQLKTNDGFTKLEDIYYRLDRKNMGHIIAFYSLIHCICDENSAELDLYQIQGISYWTRLTIVDFQKAKNQHLIEQLPPPPPLPN